MRILIIAFAALLAGAVAGWWAHAALAESSARSARPRDAQARAVEAAQASELAHSDPVSDAREHAPAPAPPTIETVRTEEAGLISAALRKYALDELHAGWAELRKDPMPEPTAERGFSLFDEQLRALPRAIGRELAKQQTTNETLAGEDVLAIVQTLHESSLGPQPQLVHDRERFDRLFECAAGPAVEGVRPRSEPCAPFADGTRIVFPPGAYSLQRLSSCLEHSQPPARCITIQGAGMDQTLFVDARLAAREGIQRFTLRDCTLEGLDVIDARSGANALELERVRFVGFDVAAGSSNPFRSSAGVALHLSDCRIEGGYGRHPGSGNLFDVRTDGVLARFDRCQLSGLSLPLDWLHSGATILFADCRLTDMFDRDPLTDDESGRLTFERCRIEMHDKQSGEPARRDLNELFPGWQKNVVR